MASVLNLYEKSNIFRLNIEGLDKLHILIIPSDIFSVSVSQVNKLLKEFIISKGWESRGFVYITKGITEGTYLVVLLPQEDMVKEAVETLPDLIKKDYEKDITNILKYYYFDNIPKEYRSIAYATLSRCVEHWTLLSLSKMGWIITAPGQKVYTQKDEKLVVDLPEPLANYIRLYRGVHLASIPLVMYDALEREYLGVGLSIDPVLIIEPSRNLFDLMNEGIKYTERKLLRKIIIPNRLFNYGIVKYETWDILMLTDKEVRASRMDRSRESSWKLREESFDLKDVYPLRRPEVIDKLLSDKHYSPRLTYIVKKESFQITEEGKKDEMAPYKRYLITKEFYNIIREGTSKHKFLGELEMILEEDPLGLISHNM